MHIHALMIFAVSWEISRVQQMTALHCGWAAPVMTESSEWHLGALHGPTAETQNCWYKPPMPCGSKLQGRGNLDFWAQNTSPYYRQLRESGLCHNCLETAAPQRVCVYERESGKGSSSANGQIWSWQTHVMREIKVVPNALCSCKWADTRCKMEKKKKGRWTTKGEERPL